MNVNLSYVCRYVCIYLYLVVYIYKIHVYNIYILLK